MTRHLAPFTPNDAFKKHFSECFQGVQVFEHKLPILRVWPFDVFYFPLPQPDISIYCTSSNRLKFCSVTLLVYIWGRTCSLKNFPWWFRIILMLYNKFSQGHKCKLLIMSFWVDFFLLSDSQSHECSLKCVRIFSHWNSSSVLCSKNICLSWVPSDVIRS